MEHSARPSSTVPSSTPRAGAGSSTTRRAAMRAPIPRPSWTASASATPGSSQATHGSSHPTRLPGSACTFPSWAAGANGSEAGLRGRSGGFIIRRVHVIAARSRYMPLSHIEHYLIAADDMERTRDWYRDVLGMQEGWHPDFGFPVYWMYLDGKDVVHIGRSARHASENQKAYLGRIAQDTGGGT